MSHLKFVNETLREPVARGYGALGTAYCKSLSIKVLW
jgi:hypothetical protein